MPDNKTENELIPKQQAIDEVRMMATQFADMYFVFVDTIRSEYGEEAATAIVQKVLFMRAMERGEKMKTLADEKGLERTPASIPAVVDVPFLGWVLDIGKDMCPYGKAWNDRVEKHPWFRKYAAMYCDVTDTTVAEVFTGAYSHRVLQSTARGDNTCSNTYFISDDVKQGKLTYEPEQ